MAFDKNKAMLAAQKFIQKGQYEKAIKEYNRIAREDPNDIKVRQKLGDLYARENKKEEALVEYNYVGKYYADDGFYLRAIAVYKQVLKLDPAQIQINLKLADLYHKQNLIGDAIKQFQFVYSYYERKGDTIKALDTLDKMAEMAPANLSLRMRLADAYYRNGFVDRSLDEYVKIGEQLKKEGRTEDLIKLYERLIKHHPSRLDMLINVAEIYLKMNKRDMAEARIEMGLKASPDDLKLLYLKSRILLLKEDNEASIEILSKILDINPEFIEAKEELVRVYEKMGRKKPLEKFYTELMIYFRGKGEEEKAGHYKALYNNLKGAVSEEMTGPGLTSDLTDEGAEFKEAQLLDAEVIEMTDDDVLEAEIFEEVPEVEEEIAGEVTEFEETMDNEGRLLMLKIDTYVKYGQYKEATDALKEYSKKNPYFITPKRRLTDIYLELVEKKDDPQQYRTLAAQELADLSILLRERSEIALADSEMERALELDPNVTPSEVYEEVPAAEAGEFDVVLDEQVELGEVGEVVSFTSADEAEIPDTIDMGDIGAEPIEISIDAEGLSEDFEDIVEEKEILGASQTSSGLIDMTPKDEPLPEGEDYFDLKKELEEVVLDDDMHLESKGGAGLLGKDDHYSFEDVFDEFKKGVEKQFGKEDYETHYNLGIAYREMGLFEDAISEFIISANDPKKKLDSFIMLGVIHRDIGELEKSIDYFREIIDSPGIESRERLGINYELALSYEMINDPSQAYPIYEKIYSEDPNFRDIAEKVKSLRGAAKADSGDKKGGDSPKMKKTKDKISYV